jgi:hypothetical protein
LLSKIETPAPNSRSRRRRMALFRTTDLDGMAYEMGSADPQRKNRPAVARFGIL